MSAGVQPTPPSLPPTLTTAVPKELVHKRSLNEVLLTGWSPSGGDSFTVTAQWPRAHVFYTALRGLHDPMLFVETVRQSIPLLSHAAYDVPFGQHLIWDRFDYALAPDALRTEAAPVDLVLRIECSDVARRRGVLSALTMRVDAERDGARLGTATARFTAQSPAVYRRFRGAYADAERAMERAIAPPLPVPSEQVARERPGDVVLSPTDVPHRWQLRVDTSHPVLFDHPVDHVPGMLVLEAARQAALAAQGEQPAVPVAMEAVFHRYAEFDAPCWIEARVPADGRPGPSPTQVTAHQSGRDVFSATLTTQPAPQLCGRP